MQILPISQNNKKLRYSFMSKNEQTNEIKQPVEKKTSQKNDKILPLVSVAVAIASLGIATYALRKKPSNALKEEATNAMKDTAAELKKGADDLTNELKNKVDSLESRINEVANKANKTETTLNQKVEWFDGFNKGTSEKISKLESMQSASKNILERNVAHVDGLTLLQNFNNEGNRIMPSAELVKQTQTAAMKFITGKQNGIAIATPILGASASIWLPTAESLPEKEGGLGEVPVQIAKNLDKEIGVDNYLLRPLSEIPGTSSLIENSGRYYYSYKDTSMELSKVAEYDTYVYRNGKYEKQNVEVFYGIDPNHGHKRLMFRNQDFFKSPGLYANTQLVSEPERYAFFSKLVYEFAKLKLDPKSMTSYKIFDKSLFDSIKAPDAMVLNDWHTAPVAALMRLKAPFEANNKELSSSSADRLANMNLLYLVHNAEYQGKDWAHASDILNTLFDKYSLDIYSNAKSGFVTYNQANQEVEMEGLKNTLMIDGAINMANMAMAYATKTAPVSRTYSYEMANQPERGHALQHISKVRLENGTMEGRSNGWDRSSNEVSHSNLKKFNKNLNGDSFGKLIYEINKIKDLTLDERKRIDVIFADNAPKGLNMDNFPIIIDKLSNLNIPALELVLEKLRKEGVLKLRKFKAATSDMSIDEIMANRLYNKGKLVQYIKSIVEYNKANGNVFNIKSLNTTDFSSIDESKLDEIPIFNMGVRFTDQKGVDIFCGAMYQIYSEWDSLFPGKEKPISIVGGKDSSADGKYYRMVEGTKNGLKDKGHRLLQMFDFVPNDILMTGSDYTLRPSHFEPDGDKWESLYKGTPVILTNLGGHVDSLYGKGNGILTKRTVPEIHEALKTKPNPENKSYEERFLDEEIHDYKEALIEALRIFYNDKEAYKQMVNKGINGNQSWVQRDEQGKITNCPVVAHMRDLGFNFKDPAFGNIFADNVK